MTTLLRGIVGSHAYGLAHEDSDVDRLGVFAAPTLEVAGLDWHATKESNVKQAPEGDDFAEHEVGKFFKLVLKANPTVQELLWLPQENYLTHTLEGNMMLDMRSAFLSRKPVWSAYHGYASAQLAKFRASHAREGIKLKHARHAIRLIEQGRRLYTEGELHTLVENPQRYWDLAAQPYEQVIETIQRDLDGWSETDATPLPEEPARETVRDLLSYIRRNHLEG
jgi:hypothetical protein